MKDTTFTDRVRKAFSMVDTPGLPVGYDELLEILELKAHADKRPFYRAMTDMVKAGEVKRLGVGIVQYIGKTSAPDVRDRMWSVLRMRKSASVEDLMELTGADRKYVHDFMRVLIRRECVKAITRPDKIRVYCLVKDTGAETPENTEKKDYMKRFHKARKEALELIGTAGDAMMEATSAIIKARMIINDMEEPGEEVDA
jgi:hypothetical protein